MAVPGRFYRWSPSEFVRAFGAGTSDFRVELVEGEIWPVAVADWHGRVAMRLAGVLPRDGAEISSATLPTLDSMPEPDCWVIRSGAAPVGQATPRVSIWSPADILLVVEVSDETVVQDLNVKTRLYGSAGYPVYWVVTKDQIFEHTGPAAAGYRHRTEYVRGDRIPVGYAGTEILVDDLI